MKQNIYDNECFFHSFKELRERDDCYNVLLEQPAMKKMLPDLTGKRVLDLGCGFGINCVDFVRLGAKQVTGVDISKRMIRYASKNNADDKITYIHLPLEELKSLDGEYDFIYSSLCFHYVQDFGKLINDIYSLLSCGGVLLFSQEHPIVTASAGIANQYITDDKGNKVFCFCKYQDEHAKRVEEWFDEGVIKYHRTFSTIVNTLCDTGFAIQKIVEPIPDAYALEKRGGLSKEFIKPTFLIVKAIKAGD